MYKIKPPMFAKKVQPEIKEKIKQMDYPSLDGVFHIFNSLGKYFLVVHKSQVHQLTPFCMSLAKSNDFLNKDFYFFNGNTDWVVPLCELRANNNLPIEKDVLLYLFHSFPEYKKQIHSRISYLALKNLEDIQEVIRWKKEDYLNQFEFI